MSASTSAGRYAGRRGARNGRAVRCLTYRVRIGGGEWEDVNETVRIVRTPCRFGGTRPYFVCPGVVNGTTCGRRVAKLYGPGRYFVCRLCYRLAYASQSEDAQRRSMRRANRSENDSAAMPEQPPRCCHGNLASAERSSA